MTESVTCDVTTRSPSFLVCDLSVGLFSGVDQVDGASGEDDLISVHLNAMARCELTDWPNFHYRRWRITELGEFEPSVPRRSHAYRVPSTTAKQDNCKCSIGKRYPQSTCLVL